MTGYCVKCKSQQEIVDARDIVTKRGGKAVQGKCTECGTTVTRFGASSS